MTGKLRLDQRWQGVASTHIIGLYPAIFIQLTRESTIATSSDVGRVEQQCNRLQRMKAPQLRGFEF